MEAVREVQFGIPEEAGSLVVRVADGDHAEELRGQRVPLEGSIMGEVVEMGAAALLDDAVCHGGLADPMVDLDLGPALFVPLTSGKRAFGSLCVARHRGRALFTEQEVAAPSRRQPSGHGRAGRPRPAGDGQAGGHP